MGSETQSNEEENSVKSKQEHIKERLKEMGVSQDSVRPEQSWLAKYSKYFFLIVISALVVAYLFVYKIQDAGYEETIAQAENPVLPVQQGNPYSGYYQNNRMNEYGYPQGQWQQLPASYWADGSRAHSNDAMQSNESIPDNSYAHYQPQYPSYAQPYWSGYTGYYQMRAPVMRGYAYRNMPQSYPETYQQPANNSYPAPEVSQRHYYGWQR